MQQRDRRLMLTKAHRSCSESPAASQLLFPLFILYILRYTVGRSCAGAYGGRQSLGDDVPQIPPGSEGSNGSGYIRCLVTLSIIMRFCFFCQKLFEDPICVLLRREGSSGSFPTKSLQPCGIVISTSRRSSFTIKVNSGPRSLAPSS